MRQVMLRLAICFLVLLAPGAVAQTLVAQIPVPPLFVSDIAVNPFTNTVYVTSSNPAELTVIDGRTRTVRRTLVLDAPQAQAVAVNPVSNRVYVSTHDIATGNSNVVVIDGRTSRIIDTVYVSSGGGGLVSLAVDAVRNRIYAADANNAAIAIIDGHSDRVVDLVSLGLTPNSIALNYLTNRLYISTNSPTGQLLVLNGFTRAVSQSVFVGQPVTQVDVDVANNRVFLLAPGNQTAGSGAIYVVDGGRNRIVAVIPGFNFSIAVDPLSNTLWAVSIVPSETGHATGTVSLIDATRNRVLSTTSIPDYGKIAVNPVTDTGYVLGFFGEVDVVTARR